MKQIALIPIDNRPVCYQLPQQIINLTDEYKLILPDKKLLGSLVKNADINGLFDWIESIKNIDMIIISLDTIAYGGLIPSRRSNESLGNIKARILKLKEILEEKHIKIFAFSSIMRISNNNVNEEEKEYWNIYGTKIFQYSYNLHKEEKTGQSYATTDIPVNVLNDYLKTRKRNFEMNKFYIELKKNGFFDTLVFSKDDCAEFGLNVKEAEELKKLSCGIEGIFVKTGADEIPITLLSRAINKDKNIKIAPVYLNPESINKISKYEDISVKNSVESQIELSGGIVSNEEDCDLRLIVNNFSKEQGELVMDVDVPLFSGSLNIPKTPYFIADILNANGSDNNFVNELLKIEDLKDFYGYAAWNTTGNTLGSAIAAALCLYNAKTKKKEAFNILQLTRFLDDWAYQANIRGKIRNNNNNLTSDIVKEYIKPFEDILIKKFPVKDIDLEYSFPWNRFFEIEICLSKKEEKINK